MIAVAVALLPWNREMITSGRSMRITRDHVAQHVLPAPLVERLVQPLRESVVDDRREVLLIHAVVAVGGQQLLGPDQAQGIEQLRSRSRCRPTPRA